MSDEKNNGKTFGRKKLPGLFKKKYTEKKLDKILKKLSIPEDRDSVRSLFQKGTDLKKPELFAVPVSRAFTKVEIRHYKMLAKEIKGQKGRFKLLPLVAVCSLVALAVVASSMFKNRIARKVLVNALENVAGAKVDVSSVDLRIFGTSLTVNNLAVGNRDDEFQNILEADRIHAGFSLVQALRGKFAADSIQVSGIKAMTARKTSCRLPEKSKEEKKKSKQKNPDAVQQVQENPVMKSIEAKTDACGKSMKDQAASMLGGSSVEEILSGLLGQLKCPQVAENVGRQAEALVDKWKEKPDEIVGDVKKFGDTVYALQKINVSKMDNPDEIRSAIKKVSDAINSVGELESSVNRLVDDVKSDSAALRKLSEDAADAMKSDLKFAESKLGSAVNTLKNAKDLFNSALDTVGYSYLGKYYPYAQKAVYYAQKLRESSSEKKAVEKKKNSRRLAGTTFWYSKENPRFVVKRVFVSGENFEMTVNDVSSNQDLYGKPAVADGKIIAGPVTHGFRLTVDARKKSDAKLIAADYRGSGVPVDFNGTEVASSSGIPVIEGSGDVTASGEFDLGYFALSGKISLAPLKITSDGFGNETATRFYNKALAAVTGLDAGFRSSWSDSDGILLALTGNYSDQFAKVLKTILESVGNEVRDEALRQLRKIISSNENKYLAKINEFMGIEDIISGQQLQLGKLRKTLDAKQEELEKYLEAELKKNMNKAMNEATKELDKATGGALKDIEKAAGVSTDDVERAAEGAVKDVGKAVKGFFKGF